MSKVKLLYDRVMVEIECREAPLGIYDGMSKDIDLWLTSRLGEDWDWDVDQLGDYVVFDIPDDRTALLFKLTFGGI